MSQFKKNKEIYMLASILPMFIIMSMHNILIIIGLIASIVYFCYINYYTLKHESNIIPKLIIMLLLMQNVGIGIGGHIAGNTSGALSIVTQIPSLFILISAIFVLLRRKLVKTDLIFGIYVIIIIIYFFAGDGPVGAKAVYLRNFAIFYLAYIIGAYYLKDRNLRCDFIKFVLTMAIGAGVFGIIGIVFGKPFYDLVGVNEVYIAKKYIAFVDGLPGNFKTLFGSQWVNRLASLYYEPVNFSYFMSFSVILAATKKRWKTFIFLFICECLTFGKGGLLVMTAAAVCFIAHVTVKRLLPKWSLRKIKNFILLGMVGGVTLLAIVFYLFLTDIFGGYMHFYGIITGIEAILQWPLGHGLGTAGNIVRQFENNGIFDISETGLVNMGYQIGIIGIILFILILSILSINAYNYYKNNIELKNKTDYLGLLSLYMPIILLVVFTFQENTFTPQCIVPYMLIQGSFYCGINNKESKFPPMKWLSVCVEKLNKYKPQINIKA